MHPPLPVPDEVSAPFWAGARRRELVIQRCRGCRRYAFPPRSACEECGAAELGYERVSGRGRVYSYSLTVSGARHPYFAAAAPYLVGFVELAEQAELVMLTNFPGATAATITIGAPVVVVYQPLADGVVIPQFRLSDDAR
jgi:hypothetical protein